MDSSNHQVASQNTQEFQKKFYEIIKSENFEEFKKFIKKGANVYQILDCGDAMSSVTGRSLALPFLTALQYCISDQIPNFILDIYENDLEVLKGTNYKRALVAMPEFQTEEFMKCCKFDVPMDESEFEDVLIKERYEKVDKVEDSTSLNSNGSKNLSDKQEIEDLLKNGLEDKKCPISMHHDDPDQLKLKPSRKSEEKSIFQPPKLAFLSKTDEISSKFISQLEEIGPCDLNFKLPFNEASGGVSFLRQAFLSSSHLNIARRLLKSPFVSDELKSKDLKDFCEHVLCHYDIWEFKEFFVDYEFSTHDLYTAISYNSAKSFDFITKKFMEQKNCTWKELLRLKFTTFVLGDKQTTLIHEIFKIFAQDRLDLTFDDDDLLVENEAGENCLNFLFNMYVAEAGPILKFIKKHPKLLTMRTNENLSIVHCAVALGNVEILEEVIKIMDSKFDFLEDEYAAVKCLHKDYMTYEIDHKKLKEILQTLMEGKFEEFFTKHAAKILIAFLVSSYTPKVIDFYLNLPIKFDLNEMHDGKNVYMAACQTCEEKTIMKIIGYQDVDDWNISGSDGATLFMAACSAFYDDPKLIKSIIKKQPDCTDKMTADGSTALFFVRNHPYGTIAKILIDAGVDPKVMNKDGYTAIRWAVNNAEVFKVLLPFESDEDLRKQYPPENATILELVENVEVAKVLLTRNVDFNITRDGNLTPLFPYHSDELTQLYMDHIVANNLDVDVNIQNYDGNTALAQSIMDENHKYFEKFVKSFKNKIDFDICDEDDKNFARQIMDVSDYGRADFLKTVKEEVVEEFLTRLKQDDEHGYGKYRPDSVKTLVEVFGLECLRENVKYFVDIEEILEGIFEQFPDFLEVSEDFDQKVSFFIEALRNCCRSKSFEILLGKFGTENVEICRDKLMEIIYAKNDQEFLEMFLKISPK